MQASWSWALFILLSWLSHPHNTPSTSVAIAPPSVPRLYVQKKKKIIYCLIHGSNGQMLRMLGEYFLNFWSLKHKNLGWGLILKSLFLCLSVQAFPPGGIYIFASQLHTHLAGRGVRTVLVRGGKELEVVQEDQHFSTHYQVSNSRGEFTQRNSVQSSTFVYFMLDCVRLEKSFSSHHTELSGTGTKIIPIKVTEK